MATVSNTAQSYIVQTPDDVTRGIITQVTTLDNDAGRSKPHKKKHTKSVLSRLYNWLRCTSENQTAPMREKAPTTLVAERSLLRAQDAHLMHKKCLVLDMDETLIHSSFKHVDNADFVIPVEIDGQEHQVYVLKRPFVDEFLLVMGRYFEIVVFTASLSKYADPVLDQLDIHRAVHHRLFRESCHFHRGNYVKDLSKLGRILPSTIIIDNSPASYIFHPEHALSISTWLDDPSDTELLDLIPFLVDLSQSDDHVSSLLSRFNENPSDFKQRDRATVLIQEASKEDIRG